MAQRRGVRTGLLAARLAPDFLAQAACAAARDAGVPWAAVVGGYVRSRLLGSPAADLDLVVPERGVAVAGRVADAIGGRVVPLARWHQWLVFHPERRIDVTEADDLDSDLARRDLTVNAVAWIVHPSAGQVLDPLGGLRDLVAGRLVPCRPDSLSADPARVIRAARLVAFGFVPTRALYTATRAAARGLADVSSDRVWREWRLIATAPAPDAALRFLDETGALDSWLAAGMASAQEAGPVASERMVEPGQAQVALAEAQVALAAEGDPRLLVRAFAVRALEGRRYRRALWRSQAMRLGCTRGEAARALVGVREGA